MKKKVLYYFLAFMLLIVFLVQTGCKKDAPVARALSNDTWLGPIVFSEDIYFIVPESFPEESNTKSLGFFEFKDTESTWITRLIIGEDSIVGEIGDDSHKCIKIRGGLSYDYEKASLVENEEIIFSKESTCMILAEKWLELAARSEDGKNDGRYQASDEFVILLEQQFGVVTYHIEDFSEYDQLYEVVQYKNSDLELGGGVPRFIGCIFYVNDKYYYGNYDNEITGVTLLQLNEIIRESSS